MSGISSIGSSTSSASYSNPLDKNGDGVVDAQELQAAAQSGLLSASILADEDDSDPSATDKFSNSLAGMLLQMQQSDGSGDSSSNSGSSTQSPIDALFASMDANGDGKVSSDEFVAGRPKDMSTDDATALFKSLDQQDAGSLDKEQFADGFGALNSADPAAANSPSPVSGNADGSDASSAKDGNPLDAFLAEMQSAMNAYQNTYGQYDADPTDTVSA